MFLFKKMIQCKDTCVSCRELDLRWKVDLLHFNLLHFSVNFLRFVLLVGNIIEDLHYTALLGLIIFFALPLF